MEGPDCCAMFLVYGEPPDKTPTGLVLTGCTFDLLLDGSPPTPKDAAAIDVVFAVALRGPAGVGRFHISISPADPMLIMPPQDRDFNAKFTRSDVATFHFFRFAGLVIPKVGVYRATLTEAGNHLVWIDFLVRCRESKR